MISYSSREDVLESICNASYLNNLGLFVGAGFTKAVAANSIANSNRMKAYSWKELLQKCATELNVNEDLFSHGWSYSECATQLCKMSSKTENDYPKAVQKLKENISILTSIYPSKDCAAYYKDMLNDLLINWIVTTNYDTVLESIFAGESISLGPTESLIKVKNLIPIYHIHGIHTLPATIIITNEDYVTLFRPNDYRQARLPFLMKESVVLMMGYALGDINVATAVDWSCNFYTNQNNSYSSSIIQLHYTSNPRECPYIDTTGVTVIDIENFESFFQSISSHLKGYNVKQGSIKAKITALAKIFVSPENDSVEKFIHNPLERERIISFLKNLQHEYSYIYNNFSIFLAVVFAKLDEKTRIPGAFEAYNEKLIILLDLFSLYTSAESLSSIPPTFFSLLAQELFDLAWYIGPNPGESYSAKRTWDAKKTELSESLFDELRKYATTKSSCSPLEQLLETKNSKCK